MFKKNDLSIVLILINVVSLVCFESELVLFFLDKYISSIIR